MWMRSNVKLPEDPAIHLCALAYESDLTLLDATLARYGKGFFQQDMVGVSLDHAMWFHRPFRADEWLLYSQDSPNAHGGRALARASVFKPDGTLVATVAQEGVLRARRAGASMPAASKTDLP
jgi:acyl-CoA thioesterase-2